MGVLAQLIGLQVLTCGERQPNPPGGAMHGGSITRAGLLQLTALKQLESLCFTRHSARATQFKALLGPALQPLVWHGDPCMGFLSQVRPPGSACMPDSSALAHLTHQ